MVASSGEGASEAPPVNWRLVRSVALASLVPFFLLSLGHYFSLSLVLADYLLGARGTYQYFGDDFFWGASDHQKADALIRTAMTVAALSFLLLCLSMLATVSVSSSINTGRRLTVEESFSKVRGLWKGPSAARLHFTILFLGYVLSLAVVVVVVVVTLVATGSAIMSWGSLYAPVFLLALCMSLYFGVLRYVGLNTFLREEGGGGVEAIWRTWALMDETKLQGFMFFFLSLVITQGWFLVGGLGMDAALLLPGALLLDTFWTVGTCALFGYVGVLLQV